MISVRQARAADWAALQRLWAQVDRLHARLHPGFFTDAAGTARPLPTAPDCAMFVAQLAADGGPEVLGTGEAFAPEQGRATIVGAVRVRVYDTPDDPLMVVQRRGYVEELVVDASHRRGGVGRLLMDRAAAWCRARGASALLLTVWSGNEEAEAFYARLGYGVLNRVLGRELD